ncbi:hypothetical protein AAW12_06900 [Sphingobacterium sp. Ag1]|nr:hypothetical protein AAW12_06900 [Sphingobacterium sp. Ag1]
MIFLTVDMLLLLGIKRAICSVSISVERTLVLLVLFFANRGLFYSNYFLLIVGEMEKSFIKFINMLYQIIHFAAHVLRIDKFNVILIRYYEGD